MSGQESLTELVTLNNNLKEVEVRKDHRIFQRRTFQVDVRQQVKRPQLGFLRTGKEVGQAMGLVRDLYRQL